VPIIKSKSEKSKEYSDIISKHFILNPKIIVNLQSEYLNSNQLPPENISAVITAPLGIGKSHSFIQKAKLMAQQGKTIIIACSRVCLCDQYKAAFNTCFCYYDKNKTVGIGINICIYEQAEKVKQELLPLGVIADLITIEEYHALKYDNFRSEANLKLIESINQYFTPFMNKRPTIQLISATPCISVIDKFDVDLEFYQYSSTKPTKPVSIVVFDNIYSGVEYLIIEYLNAGYRVIVNWDNKIENAKLICKYKSLFKDNKSSYLVTETKDDARRDFENLNLIVSTSVIDSGYNIEDGKPTISLVIATEDNIKPIIQKIGRVRSNAKYILVVDSKLVSKKHPKKRYKKRSNKSILNNLNNTEDYGSDDNFIPIVKQALSKNIKTKSVERKPIYSSLGLNPPNGMKHQKTTRDLVYISNEYYFIKAIIEDDLFRIMFNKITAVINGLTFEDVHIIHNANTEENVFVGFLLSTIGENQFLNLTNLEIKVLAIIQISNLLGKINLNEIGQIKVKYKSDIKIFNDYFLNKHNIEPNTNIEEKFCSVFPCTSYVGFKKWLLSIRRVLVLSDNLDFNNIKTLILHCDSIQNTKLSKNIAPIDAINQYYSEDKVIKNEDSISLKKNLAIFIAGEFRSTLIKRMELERIDSVTYTIKDAKEFLNIYVHQKSDPKEPSNQMAQNIGYSDYNFINKVFKSIVCTFGEKTIINKKYFFIFRKDSIDAFKKIIDNNLKTITQIFQNFYVIGYSFDIVNQLQHVRDYFDYENKNNLLTKGDPEDIPTTNRNGVGIKEAKDHLINIGYGKISINTLKSWIDVNGIGYRCDFTGQWFVELDKLEKFVKMDLTLKTKYLSVSDAAKMFKRPISNEYMVKLIQKFNLGHKVGGLWKVDYFKLLNYIKTK